MLRLGDTESKYHQSKEVLFAAESLGPSRLYFEEVNSGITSPLAAIEEIFLMLAMSFKSLNFVQGKKEGNADTLAATKSQGNGEILILSKILKTRRMICGKKTCFKTDLQLAGISDAIHPDLAMTYKSYCGMLNKFSQNNRPSLNFNRS